MSESDSEEEDRAVRVPECTRDQPPILLNGYSCQFVESPSELQYECSICLFTVRNPHLVSCCGYRFCAECIKQVKSKGNKCPLCSEAFTIFPDKLLQRTLMNKQVFCSSASLGCPWTGKLSELDSHLLKCEFAPIRCPNSCGQNSLPRMSVESHVLNDCPLTILQCSVCNKSIARKDMLAHKKIFAEDHISTLESQVEKVKEENSSIKEMVLRESVELVQSLTPMIEDLESTKPRKVCIQNLPRHACNNIKSYCGMYGSVVEVRFFRSLSTAVVEFEDHDSVKRLIEQTGELSERYVNIHLWGEVLRFVPFN